eukprot:scaffold22060_cov68-Phaeocystis_antarctica.AAC.5
MDPARRTLTTCARGVREVEHLPLCGVTPSGGARQGPIAGYVLQSAAPAGPSPWVYRGVSALPYTAPSCLGHREGPSIAELRSVLVV